MINERRISRCVVVLFFFSIALNAQQSHKQLSAAEKERILDGPFTAVTRTEAMPANAKQAFAKITGERTEISGYGCRG
jgi:hypothetical protein